MVDCPEWDDDCRIKVYHSAVATYVAPSDSCGVGGMHHERIHASPGWRHDPMGRYDCALVTVDAEAPGFRGFEAVRIRLFFDFQRETDTKPHACALVEWFSKCGPAPCADTGMWIVEPDMDTSQNRVMSVIHVDSMYRGVHLLPVFGRSRVPTEPDCLLHSHTLDAFKAFYVSKYADHHAHEILF